METEAFLLDNQGMPELYCQFCIDISTNTHDNENTNDDDKINRPMKQQSQKSLNDNNDDDSDDDDDDDEMNVMPIEKLFCRLVATADNPNNDTFDIELEIQDLLFTNPNVLQESFLQLIKIQKKKNYDNDPNHNNKDNNMNDDEDNFDDKDDANANESIDSPRSIEDRVTDSRDDEDIASVSPIGAFDNDINDDDEENDYIADITTSFSNDPLYEAEMDRIEATLVNSIPLLKAFRTTFHPSYQNVINNNQFKKLTQWQEEQRGSLPNLHSTSKTDATTISKQQQQQPRLCIGHKERVLGCDFSFCGQYLATASQESNVCIWKTSTNTIISKIQLNEQYEVLRVTWAHPDWAQNKETSTSSSSSSNLQLYKYILATGGADGIVSIFGSNNPEHGITNSWICLYTIDHSKLNHFQYRIDIDPNDRPQIYSLQFITCWKKVKLTTKQPSTESEPSLTSALITSSDDHLHIWEVDNNSKVSDDDENNYSNDNSSRKKLKLSDESSIPVSHPVESSQSILREVYSVKFSSEFQDPNLAYGVNVISVTRQTSNVTIEEMKQKQHENNSNQHSSSSPKQDNIRTQFGGDRNPNNTIFVFDVSYCVANELIGVALSDGTLRVLNTLGQCVSVLHLPDHQSHLTSVSWNSKGTYLATCVGTGHLITWKVNIISNSPNEPEQQDKLQPAVQITWNAVFSGGHIPDTPLFGAKYLSMTGSNPTDAECETEQCLISWGSDGQLCLWDCRAEGELNAPISILLSQPDYPIYAVAVVRRRLRIVNNGSSAQQSATNANHGTFAITGGGTQGGFIGIPVYLYDT